VVGPPRAPRSGFGGACYIIPYKRLRLIGDIDAMIADSADLIAAHGLDLDTVRDVLAQDMGGAG